MITLVVLLLQVSVITSLAFLLSKFLQGKAPSLSANLALVGMLASCLAVFLAAADIPRFFEIRSPTSTIISQSEPYASAGFSQPIISLEIPTSFPLQQVHKFKATKPGWFWGIEKTANGIVMLLVAVALFRCVVGSIELIRLIQTSYSAPESALNQELLSLANTLQLARPATLRVSHKIQAPCVCWLRPYVIFVPQEFSRWNQLERQTALTHELQHISRADAWWRFIGELATACVAFHPFAWILRKQFIAAQEIATDRRASEQFNTTEQYRKGLSMLALRMDSQSRQLTFLEVSITTNTVVRRIKMLKHEITPLPFRRKALATTALLLATGIALAWSAKADDPIRIASLPKAKSKAAATFSRPVMQPQTKLGARNGYLAIRPSLLCNNEMWKKYWLSAEQSAKSNGYDLSALGINQENLELASFDFSLLVGIVPEEEREEDGQRGSITFGASAFRVETHEDVNWMNAWDSTPMIDFFKPIVGEAVQSIQEKLQEAGTSNELSILSDSKVDEKDTAVLQEITALLDGGMLVQSSRIVEEVRSNLKQIPQDVDPVQMMAWLQETEAFGVGIDIDANGTHHLRIALVPNEDANIDQYSTRLKKTLKNCSAALEQLPAGASTGLASLSDQLSACSTTKTQLKSEREVCMLNLEVPSEVVATIINMTVNNQP